MDVTQKFSLGTSLTPEQLAFFNRYGFIHFSNVFSADEVKAIHDSIDKTQAKLVHEKVEKINGVPVFYGKNKKGDFIPQRMPFMQRFSEPLKNIVESNRLSPLQALIPDARMGYEERDGIVVNHYLNEEGSKAKDLGWHTDALRDVFYFEKIRPMLNVGIQISPSSNDGGLAIIPGTHEQSVFSILFRKIHFLHSKKDKNELIVNVSPGDLTVHDGRMWHCARTPNSHLGNVRRSIYFPILCGPQKLKSENSKTPFYLRFKPSEKIK
jgi:phytanoyl-CoA hydroxylase